MRSASHFVNSCRPHVRSTSHLVDSGRPRVRCASHFVDSCRLRVSCTSHFIDCSRSRILFARLAADGRAERQQDEGPFAPGARGPNRWRSGSPTPKRLVHDSSSRSGERHKLSHRGGASRAKFPNPSPEPMPFVSVRRGESSPLIRPCADATAGTGRASVDAYGRRETRGAYSSRDPGARRL